MAARPLSVLISMATLTASAAAFAEYAIQVGAYERPALADTTAAAKVGEVHTVAHASGLTRILVGRFGSVADSQAALEALRAAGYRDAFVTRLGDDAAPVRAETVLQAGATGSAGPEEMRWAHLSKELRAKLVLVDGRPYIKDGQTFTPLEDYVAR